MRFGAIANSARGGPQRPPPMGDRVNIPAGIPVNSGIQFRPETELSMKSPVPDKPEPDSNLKFLVPAMLNGSGF